MIIKKSDLKQVSVKFKINFGISPLKYKNEEIFYDKIYLNQHR